MLGPVCLAGPVSSLASAILSRLPASETTTAQPTVRPDSFLNGKKLPTMCEHSIERTTAFSLEHKNTYTHINKHAHNKHIANTNDTFDTSALESNVVSVDGLIFQSSCLLKCTWNGLKPVAGYSQNDSSKKRQCWGEIKAYLEGYNLYWKASGNRLRCWDLARLAGCAAAPPPRCD